VAVAIKDPNIFRHGQKPPSFPVFDDICFPITKALDEKRGKCGCSNLGQYTTLKEKNGLELQKPSEGEKLTGDPAAVSTLEFALTFAGDRTKNIES
jgi:hypothetical protein